MNANDYRRVIHADQPPGSILRIPNYPTTEEDESCNFPESGRKNQGRFAIKAFDYLGRPAIITSRDLRTGRT
jgi:hypothetical protein